jgi:hypothetical protein
VFRQNRADAELLARELPGVGAEGLQHLGPYEIALRLGLAPGSVASVATGRTLQLSAQLSDPDRTRQVSAARYGVDPAAVDAQLRERHQLDRAAAHSYQPDDAPIGRIRRQS